MVAVAPATVAGGGSPFNICERDGSQYQTHGEVAERTGGADGPQTV